MLDDEHKLMINGLILIVGPRDESTTLPGNLGLNKNPENYEYLSNASKQYKRTIKKNISRYKKAFHNKIRGMRQTSPREYWKYVNSANKKI